MASGGGDWWVMAQLLGVYVSCEYIMNVLYCIFKLILINYI